MASNGPASSSAIAGIARRLTTVQAPPTTPAAIAPPGAAGLERAEDERQGRVDERPARDRGEVRTGDPDAVPEAWRLPTHRIEASAAATRPTAMNAVMKERGHEHQGARHGVAAIEQPGAHRRRRADDHDGDQRTDQRESDQRRVRTQTRQL